jgi:hypothetical protein
MVTVYPARSFKLEVLRQIYRDRGAKRWRKSHAFAGLPASIAEILSAGQMGRGKLWAISIAHPLVRCIGARRERRTVHAEGGAAAIAVCRSRVVIVAKPLYPRLGAVAQQ